MSELKHSLNLYTDYTVNQPRSPKLYLLLKLHNTSYEFFPQIGTLGKLVV